jgi:regulator of replication initiation timing
VVTSWVEQGYLRKWAIPLKLVLDGTAVTPAPGHSIRCAIEEADSCNLGTIEWNHPGDPGLDLRWSTVCNLARCDQEIQLSVAVRLSSPSTIVKPLTYSVGRPRLIDDILAAVPCFVGKQPIPKNPTTVSAPDVVALVENALFSSDRLLPVVIISPNAWTDRLEFDPVDLQRSLLGFAQVVALRDRWAAFKLTDCIGKVLSCYNGAIRLYWPGLRLDSNPFDHPLYLPDSIRWHAQNNQPLDRYLFRLLVAISAFRFSEAPIVRSAREAIEKVKHQHIQQLLAQAKSGDSEIRQIEEELERAWDENTKLKLERDQAKEQISELSSELEAQKAAWATVQQPYTKPQSLSGPVTSEQEGPSFDNVAEVIAWAKSEFYETLIILDSAVDSAKDSPYQHPDRVAQLFQALDELVRRWKKDGKLGESWKIALRQRGFDYSDSISMTSRGKYGDDYTFVYDGKKRLFENHVTVGAKQPDSCLSVHWIRDDKKKTLVIGSCGRHGTNTSS